MAKIENLTPEQEALIPIVRDEWLNRAFLRARESFDPVAAKAGIEWLYTSAGLEIPAVLFVESPLGAQFAANLVRDLPPVWENVWANVRDNVRANVRDNVRANVWENVRDNVWANVWDNVWDNVWANVWDNVWANVRENVRENVWANVRDNVRANVRDNVRAGKLTWSEFSGFGWWCWDWAAWSDYYRRIEIDRHERAERLREFFRSNVYDTIFLRGIAIVCAPPSLISRDEQNRLSSITGPAIEWRDGYKLWWINGVRFEEELHRKVTSGEMTAKEILAIEVIDQRVVALKLHGTEKLLEELNAKKLHASARGNTLYCLEDIFPDFPKAYFLHYSCPSTGRVYVDGVDPEIASTALDADVCMAWKHNMSPEQYGCMRHEA